MATDTRELNALIAWARNKGAKVTVKWDAKALRDEGRHIHESIQVSGLKGVGPHPMSPIYFAEKLRELKSSSRNPKKVNHWLAHDLTEEAQELIDELADEIDDDPDEARAACIALLEDCGLQEDAEMLNELFQVEEEAEG